MMVGPEVAGAVTIIGGQTPPVHCAATMSLRSKRKNSKHVFLNISRSLSLIVLSERAIGLRLSISLFYSDHNLSICTAIQIPGIVDFRSRSRRMRTVDVLCCINRLKPPRQRKYPHCGRVRRGWRSQGHSISGDRVPATAKLLRKDGRQPGKANFQHQVAHSDGLHRCAYTQAIEQLSGELDASTLKRAIDEAAHYSRRYFIENSYVPHPNDAIYSLDSDYCGS